MMLNLALDNRHSNHLSIQGSSVLSSDIFRYRANTKKSIVTYSSISSFTEEFTSEPFI